MQVKLIVVHGPAKQRERVLELPAVLGRSRAATVTIGDPLVSRQHCFLEEQGGMVLVRDNGSLNGTILDGQRVQGEAIIRPGAKLTVGPLTFVVIYEPTGEGVQTDTGQMPAAVAGEPDFEAMMAGAGEGAGEDVDDESQPADDEAAATDEQESDEQEPAAPASDEEATFQWLPPPAAGAAAAPPPFLPPLAMGPAPTPKEDGADEEEPDEPAPVPKRGKRSQGKPAPSADKSKPSSDKSKTPGKSKSSPAEPSPPKQPRPEPAAAAPLSFDWLGKGTDDPAEGSEPSPGIEDEADADPAATEPTDAEPANAKLRRVEPADEDALDDRQFASDGELGAPEAEADETSRVPSPAGKPPKKKRSWWPFGKKDKSAARSKSKTPAKPSAAAPTDDETCQGEDDEETSTDAQGDDADSDVAGADAEDANPKTVAKTPGAKIGLPPAATDADEHQPAEDDPDDDDPDDNERDKGDGNDDDEGDDDAFKQFFKGIG